MQRWRKLGRLFRADGQRPFMTSHASCPMAQPLGGDHFRIWFAPRDARNRSYCAWLELEMSATPRITRLCEEPAVGPGSLGAFDEMGAMFSWLTVVDGVPHAYYTGWTIGDSVPFRNAIGLARGLGKGEGAFMRASVGPVLDRSPADPYFVGNPCVLKLGELWHLWYLSGTFWRPARDGRPASAGYDLRHATSHDGMRWTPDSGVAVPCSGTSETAIARPSVRFEEGRFRLWYSFRGDAASYRIGYAESTDGARWTRLDEQIGGLEPSDSGWDSEMIAYPNVFEWRGQPYMLYCGNGFSREGFGLAVLES